MPGEIIGSLSYILRKYVSKDVRLVDEIAGVPPTVVAVVVQEWPLLGGHVWISVPSLWDNLSLDICGHLRIDFGARLFR